MDQQLNPEGLTRAQRTRIVGGVIVYPAMLLGAWWFAKADPFGGDAVSWLKDGFPGLTLGPDDWKRFGKLFLILWLGLRSFVMVKDFLGVWLPDYLAHGPTDNPWKRPNDPWKGRF